MSLCARSIAKGQLITLNDRDIAPPVGGTVDFDVTFSAPTVVRAKVCTKRGTTLFDGVATDRPVTHKITMAYISGVTAETWVQLADGRRLDVLDVENCCEESKVLNLLCTETGTEKASEA